MDPKSKNCENHQRMCVGVCVGWAEGGGGGAGRH